jgi:MraZ protein
MSSFKGRHTYAVDDKGRIAIPLKLRKNIAPASKKKFVVTRGLELCLYLYPQDEWSKLEQFARSLSFIDASQRDFVRTLFQWADDVDPDGQFRIMLSQELKQYAGIENEVVILGVLDRIEIWSPVALAEHERKQSPTYETVAKQVYTPQQ